MSIESHILTLVEAIKENTQALRDVLAASAGTTPAPVEKPAKVKKEKPASAPVEEPVTEAPAAEEPVTKTPEPVTKTPEPVTKTPETVTEAPAAEETVTPDWDRATYLLNITEFVKGKLVADTTGSVKPAYEKIREQFGVKKAPDLTDDQLSGFWAAIQSL